MGNPYFKIIKKNERIELTAEGDIQFQDVALGIHTYLQIVSEQTKLPEVALRQDLNDLLIEIDERGKENGEV